MSDVRALVISLIILTSCTLIPPAAGEETQSNVSNAWVDGWKLQVSEDLQLHSTHQLRFFDGSYGYDDLGNFYVAFAEENVEISPNAPGETGHKSTKRAIYILKYNPDGMLEWSKNVTTTRNDCNTNDDWDCKLMGLHIIGEDTFFMTWQTYHTATYEFDNGIDVDVSGHRFAVAYHNQEGWQFADSMQTRGWTVDYVIKQDLDVNDNLIVVFKENSNGGLHEYTIRAFDENGGKWARNLEVSHENPTYDYNPLLIDVVGSQTHFFAFTKDSIRYDSQAINCPSDSTNDYCHVWFSIDSNGIKQNQVVVNYTSVKFTASLVHGNGIFLLGTTEDHTWENEDTASNFTGNMTEHGERTAFIAKLSDAGNWDLSEPVSASSGNEIYNYFQQRDEGFANLFVNKNGDVTFHFQSLDGGYYQSNYFAYPGQFTVSTYQTYITINPQGVYISHTTIGYQDTDRNSNDYSAKPVVGSNGYLAAFFEGRGGEGDVVLPDGSTHYGGLAFIDYQNGGVLEFMPIEEWNDHHMFPMAISPNGDLIVWEERRITNTWYRSFTTFAVDEDGDGIGEGDNCPIMYNLDQSDYDEDGDGDACDGDDDNDGIVDALDECPTSDLEWESNSLNNHDSDGCEDNTEDYDDDSDTIVDILDLCPRGLIGIGYDADQDGCKDSEDTDDDNDGVNDGSDGCNPGIIGWSSGSITDHDGDGCLDATEDDDDDDDGIADARDTCPRGLTNWLSNSKTDVDGDGCNDQIEDLDCCSENTDSSSPDTTEVITTVFYLCPDTLEVVANVTECPESEQISEDKNITNIIIDPMSNLSDEYEICPGGNYIVVGDTDCPEENVTSSEDETTVLIDESFEPWILYVAIASVFVSICSMLIVIFRSGSGKNKNQDKWSTESMDELFLSTSPSKSIEEWKTGKQSPPVGMSGTVDDGYEWIEWPPKSDDFWYREEDSNDEWQRYDKKK